LIKNFNKTAKNQISLNEKEKTLNQLKPFDLSKDMASLNNRPILFWHGAKDNVVPMSHSEEFVTKLKNSTYTGEVEMLKELNRESFKCFVIYLYNNFKHKVLKLYVYMV